MSRFAAYYEWAIIARKCIDGNPPAGHIAIFRHSGGVLHFPLAMIEPSGRVAEFYRELLREVEGSRLVDKRKKLYRKFTRLVISAHAALEAIKEPIGTVAKLRIPLAYLAAALKLITQLKDHDDEHPVHWSEVFPNQSVQSSLSPEELWLHFKLESIRPCLVLLMRLLRLILPEYSDTWNECERTLLGKHWISQFILDSPKSLKKSCLAHVDELGRCLPRLKLAGLPHMG
ncbi:hypothetical protein F4677DRAFT_408273 [Hypoxylon crocopeplum]|nr:hypothetical protein F4677DRAFT_408273 [Hypoxylon crocopeplum]